MRSVRTLAETGVMSGKIADFLGGVRVLEEVDSPINGKITVLRDLAWGTYIKGGGLTQSGGIVRKVWNFALESVGGNQFRKVLVIGLGGGSVAMLASKFWPEAEITGVDLDPLMVGLGKKYLGLDEKKVKIVIGDGAEVVKEKVAAGEKFDLVCVDTYVGDEFPKKFESVEFLEGVKNLLFEGGAAVFNRLYYGEKRPEAEKFEKRLERIFGSVERVYPEANVMFVCRARRLF
jgi:hypothetical protein